MNSLVALKETLTTLRRVGVALVAMPALLLGCHSGTDRAADAARVDAIQAFESSYQSGPSCTAPYSISGKEPAAPGKYPVFIYLVGTGQRFKSSAALAAVNGMADRGYVAATVDYENTTVIAAPVNGCQIYEQKASCIFDGSSVVSAVSELCAHDKADCSKGIVVAGLSQGSMLAELARNYEPRVRAVYALGTGFAEDCTWDGKRALPSDRLRAVTGEADTLVGASPDEVRAKQEGLTGLRCQSTDYACFRENGSGWSMVRNAEVEDGDADHCYLYNLGNIQGCAHTIVLETSPLDKGWAEGDAAWTLNANLDWLMGFTDR